ncbi:MAG: cation transporter [Prevotella sp.]|nr:cation transporter [Candidatus Equicola stercoris]
MKLNTIYIVAVVLNLLFVIVEVVIGLYGNSMGLLSDAGHNLGDVFGLLLAMVALKLATANNSKTRFTYGYRKGSILISLLNAIILLVAIGIIIVESIEKISHPEGVNASFVIWTAAIGIVINGATALVLAKQHKHDINTRGAFLHMLADTLVSVGVVVSGIIISYTGWYIIDPIIGLVIAVIVLVSTWGLLSESLRMSVDAVPENINTDSIVQKMQSIDGVNNVHHVHIWGISTDEVALTAHVVINDITAHHDIIHNIKEMLCQEGIHHSTLEIETKDHECNNKVCG